MSKMLRNTPNSRSTWSDICQCCRRGDGADAMVRRQQRSRERDEWRAEVNAEIERFDAEREEFAWHLWSALSRRRIPT